MSGFFWLDEPFEDGRLPTAADLDRATPLPVDSWEWAAAATDDIERRAAELRDANPEAWRREYVNEWVSPVVVPCEAADLEAAAVAFTQEPLASGGPVSPAVDLTAAMRQCGIELTPWQRHVADAVLSGDLRAASITYPRQSGRRSIARVVAAALNGAPVPLSRELTLTLTADVSGFSSAIRAAAAAADEAARSFARFDVSWWTLDEPLAVVAKRRRRRAIEQRRIRQAMRGFERRAARRQRRATSRAARGVTR